VNVAIAIPVLMAATRRNKRDLAIALVSGFVYLPEKYS
jgi:hypothetical protein